MAQTQSHLNLELFFSENQHLIGRKILSYLDVKSLVNCMFLSKKCFNFVQRQENSVNLFPRTSTCWQWVNKATISDSKVTKIACQLDELHDQCNILLSRRTLHNQFASEVRACASIMSRLVLFSNVELSNSYNSFHFNVFVVSCLKSPLRLRPPNEYLRHFIQLKKTLQGHVEKFWSDIFHLGIERLSLITEAFEEFPDYLYYCLKKAIAQGQTNVVCFFLQHPILSKDARVIGEPKIWAEKERRKYVNTFLEYYSWDDKPLYIKHFLSSIVDQEDLELFEITTSFQLWTKFGHEFRLIEDALSGSGLDFYDLDHGVQESIMGLCSKLHEEKGKLNGLLKRAFDRWPTKENEPWRDDFALKSCLSLAIDHGCLNLLKCILRHPAMGPQSRIIGGPIFWANKRRRKVLPTFFESFCGNKRLYMSFFYLMSITNHDSELGSIVSKIICNDPKLEEHVDYVKNIDGLASKDALLLVRKNIYHELETAKLVMEPDKHREIPSYLDPIACSLMNAVRTTDLDVMDLLLKNDNYLLQDLETMNQAYYLAFDGCLQRDFDDKSCAALQMLRKHYGQLGSIFSKIFCNDPNEERVDYVINNDGLASDFEKNNSSTHQALIDLAKLFDNKRLHELFSHAKNLSQIIFRGRLERDSFELKVRSVKRRVSWHEINPGKKQKLF